MVFRGTSREEFISTNCKSITFGTLRQAFKKFANPPKSKEDESLKVTITKNPQNRCTYLQHLQALKCHGEYSSDNV